MPSEDHYEYVMNRRKNELEKAELEFRAARAAFDNFRENHKKRAEAKLVLIRDEASDKLESFDPHDFILSKTAHVEECEEGYWVECKVWVSK